jgi:hypothetical protein
MIISKTRSASGDVWRKTIRVPCQAALSFCRSAKREDCEHDQVRDYKPRHVVSIVLLLLGKAIESGTDGELVNRRWSDVCSIRFDIRHYHLSMSLL